jgi:hypothetical protein
MVKKVHYEKVKKIYVFTAARIGFGFPLGLFFSHYYYNIFVICEFGQKDFRLLSFICADEWRKKRGYL